MINNGNYIKFYDSISILPLVNKEEAIKDYIENPSLKPLYARIAATHAGKVTKNNGFYFPHKMRDGSSSFLTPFNKPVLIHHNEDSDPIGRVVGARYIDISTDIKNKYISSNYRALDINNFVQGNLSFNECIKFASHYIRDLVVNTDSNYEGLGYIEIIAKITDGDAIEKVLDGRYCTGSVGVSTNKAICSVCKKDWVKEGGPCEHRPGKMYDNEKCVLLTGDLEYSEWSFVNKPADVYSKVLESNISGIQDSFSNDNSILAPEVGISLLNNTKEEFMMLLIQTVVDNLKAIEFFKDRTDLEQVVEKVYSDNEISKEDKENNIEKLVAKELNLLDEYNAFKGETNNQTSNEDKDYLKDFFADSYDAIVGDDAWGREYAEMLYGLYEDADTDEKKEQAKKLISDAKLTSEQRKKMGSSTFCGPDRSFPVNDCAHYTAALRLIGRYKGPGDKESIRACIERKGKRMGCTSDTKDSEAPKEPKFTVECFDQYSDQEVIDMLNAITLVLKERNLEFSFNTEDNSKQLDSFEKENNELKEKLDSSRKENKFLHVDLENLTFEHSKVVDKLNNVYIKHILDINKLVNKDANIDELNSSLKDKTSEELDFIFNDINGKFDVNKFNDNINSGLSNKPEKTVEDPTLITDNIKPKDTNQENKINDSLRNQLRLQWLQIRTMKGKDVADSWLDNTCNSLNINLKEVIPSLIKE